MTMAEPQAADVFRTIPNASESLQVAFNRALMKVMARRIRHSDKRMLDVLRGNA